MKHDILVLDAAQRSALAVTRSLGKLKNVRVFTADYSTIALAGTSKYSAAYFQSPNPAQAPGAYLDWIKNLCEQHRFSLIMPVTEVTSQLLLMNAEKLPGLRLPFAAYAEVMQLADKANLVDKAKALAIPVPDSRLYQSARDIDRSALVFPLVIKPCLSKIYTDAGWLTTSVQVAHSIDGFESALAKAPYLQQSPFMLQEFIPGHGAGVFCLYNQGETVNFFAHRRLREKPPQGGVSVLSESVAVPVDLKHYAQKLLDSVRWHGVAMVEFRMTPEGKPYLMEVNTRFWGSLQLAIDAGVDFPALLASAELDLDVPLTTGYRHGQRLRWLLGDIDSLYLYLKGNYSLAQKLRRIIEFIVPHPLRTRHEINRISDFKPAIHELKLYLSQLVGGR